LKDLARDLLVIAVGVMRRRGGDPRAIDGDHPDLWTKPAFAPSASTSPKSSPIASS
jgi:hypothetical protein